jgi:putative tricarboxylic transport membrane protein
MAPANPGGGWDQTARLVQQVLSTERILPVPVEVINRGGAGGTIGLAELVARDDPHTIMVMGRVMLGSILTNRSAVTLKDTAPIALLLDEFEVIAVPANSKYLTFRDLLEDFRREPQRISWGGGSAGGTDHILVAMIAQAAGVDPKKINYVAYAGGGEAAVSVMGGNVTAGISGYSEWKSYAVAGRLRFLAISSGERLGNDSPPTIKESGLNVSTSNWRAIVAPRGADASTRAWLAEALARMRQSAGWQEALRRNDWVDTFLIGAELDRFIERETASDTAVLSSIGLVTSSQSVAEYAAVGPWIFPALVAVGLLLSALWIVAAALKGPAHSSLLQPIDWKTVAAACSILLLYVLLLNPIGYLLTTTAFLLLTTRLMGSRSLVRDAVFSVVTSAFVYALFNLILKIGLPSGVLG